MHLRMMVFAPISATLSPPDRFRISSRPTTTTPSKSTFLSITVHGPTMELMILAPSRMTHPSEMIERSVNEDP